MSDGGAPDAAIEVDAGSSDASTESPDAGRDGGRVLIFQACISQQRTHAVIQLGSMRFGHCTQLLFAPDASHNWPEVKPPDGFALRDVRTADCLDRRILDDGGLDPSGRLPGRVWGRFTLFAGAPLWGISIQDGGLELDGYGFAIEAETQAVDNFCPGDP